MDTIKRIIDEAKGSVPTHSRTAMAIRNNCAPEGIATFAVKDGLNALAASIFMALEVGDGTDKKSLACVRTRLVEAYQDLPLDSATAKLIAHGARLEEISEAAQADGLNGLVAMLLEAEQEGEQ